MSDTPRTDAKLDSDSGLGGYWVPADFARELERELIRARDQLSRIYRWIDHNHPDGFADGLTHERNLDRVGDRFYSRIDAVERENAKLRAELEEERDANAWTINPSMAQAKIDELNAALAGAHDTNQRLNRRCQLAESVIAKASLVEGRPQGPKGRSFGRVMANYAADKAERERDDLRAAMSEAWSLVNAMAGQEYWDRAEEWLKANEQFRPEGAQRV